VTAAADTLTRVAEIVEQVPTKLIIGGERRAASDGATFDVIDPATGGSLTTVASGTAEDAIACVDAAHDAAPAWAARPRGNGPRFCGGPTS
jgi:succinate-semialdehyde dehydrogenase / glutarate-semialdehyde dehydrogenase